MNELQIFVEAREYEDHAERSDFLIQVTAGDGKLLRRVQNLLNIDTTENAIFDRHPESILGELAHSTYSFASLSTDSMVQEVCETINESSDTAYLGRLQHYEIIEAIGQGGFGFVLKAFDTKLHRQVAIKILRNRYSVSPSARERFLCEARAAASIRDDNTVQVYAVEEDPVPFLVMEFIDGTTLQHSIQDYAPLPVEDVLRLGVEIASGLAAAHAKNVIHRDIKPANILLDSSTNRVKVTDFGLATTDDQQLNDSGVAIAGTPPFMSPEQARGEPVDHLSDLFSLGSVLYTMCTGASPFGTRDRRQVLKRVSEDHPRTIHELNPVVPASLINVIDRLHRKEPAERFQSAKEVVDALQACRLEQAKKGEQTSWISIWLRVAACLLVLGSISFLIRSTLRTPATGVSGDAEKVRSSSSNLSGAGNVDQELKRDESVVAEKTGPEQFAELMKWMRESNLSLDEGSFVPTYVNDRLIELRAGHSSSYAGLAKLSDLERITFHGNGKTRVDLSFTEGTPNLKSIYTDSFEFTSLRSLQNLPLEYLSMWNWRTSEGVGCGQLTPLSGLPLTYLNCGHALVRDLTPLKGMPIEYLCLNNTCVKDLSPLKGMPLHTLLLTHSYVSDLSPLAGMNIRILELGGTRVKDLSPLKGSAIQILRLDDIQVDDLSVLQEMPNLQEVRIAFDPETAPYLRESLPNVAIRHGVPATAYRTLKPVNKNVDHLAIYGTSAEKNTQIERVIEKLLYKNPTMNLDECGFMMHEGKVYQFEIGLQDDLSPLAELTDLIWLKIHGSGKEIDISFVSNLKKLKALDVDNLWVKCLKPLQGLSLDELFMWTWASGSLDRSDDLDHLKGLPLTRVNLGGSCLSDLSALKGMPLYYLCANLTNVDHIRPLKGMALKTLLLRGSKVSDLSPLAGMPLEQLHVCNTNVTDLSPIRGLPIKCLGVEGLNIKDRSVIETLPIESLRMDCDPVRDREWIASLPHLKRLNNRPVEEFLESSL